MSSAIDIQSPTPNDRQEWEFIWRKYHDGATSEGMDTLWCRLENPEKMGGVIGLLIKCNGHVIGILHMQIKWGTFSQNPTLYIEDLYIEYPKRLLREIKEKGGETKTLQSLLRKTLMEAIENVLVSVKNILGGIEITKIEFDTDKGNRLAQKMYRQIAGDGHEKDGRIYYSVEPENIRE